jgi:hypothetical protein
VIKALSHPGQAVASRNYSVRGIAFILPGRTRRIVDRQTGRPRRCTATIKGIAGGAAGFLARNGGRYLRPTGPIPRPVGIP